MSRVGKAPITVPAGVKVDINGSFVSVTGKLGTLSYTFSPDVQIKLADGLLTLALSENPRPLAKSAVGRQVLGDEKVRSSSVHLVHEQRSTSKSTTQLPATVGLGKGSTGASRAIWGLSRGLLNNMVTGVSTGFEKRLEIVGVGYKASVAGKYLTLALGHSHDIKFEIPDGITIKAPKPTSLSIVGCDKQKVGQVAAMIVQQRPPEPYKGKGVKYEGQWILRKEGKKK